MNTKYVSCAYQLQFNVVVIGIFNLVREAIQENKSVSVGFCQNSLDPPPCFFTPLWSLKKQIIHELKFLKVFVIGHLTQFYLENVKAKANNVLYHIWNQVDHPPFPEKYPTASRTVTIFFWLW